MTKSKSEWFDSHVEVIGSRADEIKQALRAKVTGEKAPRLTRKELRLPTIQDMLEEPEHYFDAVDLAHYDEIERRQAIANNPRWVKSETGVASKTSKGVLSTKLNADGSITHKWEKA